MAAGLWDVLSLLFTSAFVIGVVMMVIIIPRKYREGVNAAKASLEQRGWTVSSLPREDAVGGGDGGGTGGHVVALKSNKKRMMDREHYLDATQRGIIRAVNASHFGAPQDAAAAGSHSHSSSSSSSTSSLHEDSIAGSAHLGALHSLLRHHHHHHHHHHHSHEEEAPVSGAAGVGVGDWGSDTASIIDVSAGVSATPEERQHRHPHLGRLKQLLRRPGDD